MSRSARRARPRTRQSVSRGSSGDVNLSWSAPNGGPPPAGYVIEAGSAPGLADLASLNVGNVTSFTTTAPPGVYYVRVRAVNDRGTSAPPLTRLSFNDDHRG